MGSTYFEDKKRKMFPKIDDWKDPQDKLRLKRVRNMDFYEWFWFHPSAFALLYYAMDIILSIMAAITCIYFIIRDSLIFILFAILFIISINCLIKKIRIKRIPQQNFYDIYMREY